MDVQGIWLVMVICTVVKVDWRSPLLKRWRLVHGAVINPCMDGSCEIYLPGGAYRYQWRYTVWRYHPTLGDQENHSHKIYISPVAFLRNALKWLYWISAYVSLNDARAIPNIFIYFCGYSTVQPFIGVEHVCKSITRTMVFHQLNPFN